MNPPVTDPEAREALERVRKAIVAALPENIPLRGRMSRWIMEQAVGPAIAERDATIATLTARVEALEGALRPFAKAAADWDTDQNDGHVFFDLENICHGDGDLNVGHLRAARAALNKDAPDARA